MTVEQTSTPSATPPTSTTTKTTTRRKTGEPQHYAAVRPMTRLQTNTHSPALSLNDPDTNSPNQTKIDAAAQTEGNDLDEPASKCQEINTLPTTKHVDFWNLDGNVIIQIEQTRFKLHRSWLVKHSKFFKSVFCQTYAGKRVRVEVVDGNTLYHVSGTTPGDFTELLTALDKAITYYHNDPPFSTMASVLRASTSLDFPDFRTWVVLWFENSWSDSLDDVTTYRDENAAETIALARRYNMPKVLKGAFYELLRTAGFGQAAVDDGETSEMLSADGGDDDDGAGGDEGDGDGECIDDGGDGSGDASDEEDAANGDTTAGDDNYLLSRDDIRRLITAREHLTTAWVLAAATVPNCFKCTAVRADGTTPCTCRNTTTWSKAVHRSGIFEDNLYDPINGFSALMKVDWARKGLSGDCIKVRLDAWAKQREKLWSNLDLWLEL